MDFIARIGGRKVGGGGGEAREVEEGLERRERLLEPWRNGVVSLRDWRRDIAGLMFLKEIGVVVVDKGFSPHMA